MSYVGKITDTSGNTGLVGSTLYGTCSTGASTAAKVVTCADFDKLITGVTIHVKFSYSNTAANPTLNVNSTGAKNIYYAAGTSGGTVPGTTAATSWYQGAVVSFTYDGTSWYMNDHITGISADAGSTTNPVYFSEGQPKACTYSLNKTVPSGAVFTDTNDAVTQTATTTDADYEVLFSGTADNTTRTEGVGKTTSFTFNPSKKAFTFGSRASGSTVGGWSVAMGQNVTASNYYAYAEGFRTTASAYISHAEGSKTTASGSCSHAEGAGTTASGQDSHAEGYGTTANHRSQHVFGMNNIEDPSSAAADARGNYVEIVGNGQYNTYSNARTLDWDGNEWLAGSLVVSGHDSTDDLDFTSTVSKNITVEGTYYDSGSATGYAKTLIQPTSMVIKTEHPVGTLLESAQYLPHDIQLGGTDNTWDGTNTSLKSAISSLNSSKLNKNTILRYLDGSPVATPSKITMSSSIVKFTSGEASVAFSHFGATSRPDVLILTCQSQSCAMQYMFDSSSSQVKLKLVGNSTTGNVRFCWICMIN